MLNKAIILGNLTRDVELKYTQSGTAIASFSVAVNRKWKGQDGQQQEEVSYIDVTAFGRQAEIVNQYFRKGSRILVEGRLKQDQWTDQQGAKRSKLGIVLEGFSFIDKAQQPQQPQQPQQQGYQPQQPQQPQQQGYQPQQHQQPQQGYQQPAQTPPLPEAGITEDSIPF